MAKTYVPGYGYVDSNDPDTRGSVGSSSSSNGGTPSTGTYWGNRDTTTTTTSSDSASGSSYTAGQQYYDPPVPAYEAYNRMPVRPAYTQGGYSGIPATNNTGPTANTLGSLQQAFLNDPQTRAVVMAATSAYYGYNVKNQSYAMGLLSDAAQIASANPNGPSAWSLIVGLLDGSSSMSSSSGGSGGYGGGGGGGGGGGQVSLTNPTSARGLLMQTMQNILGRNPTESEYSTFLQTLNEAQMGNPVTVGVEGDTVVQSGGVDPNVLALEFAQGAEDYKSREASKYYNMFMAALGGAAGG